MHLNAGLTSSLDLCNRTLLLPRVRLTPVFLAAQEGGPFNVKASCFRIRYNLFDTSQKNLNHLYRLGNKFYYLSHLQDPSICKATPLKN